MQKLFVASVLLNIILIAGYLILPPGGSLIKDPPVPVTPIPTEPHTSEPNQPSPRPSGTSEGCNQTAFVSRVIDGDTIELQDGTRVRLLGINTPEKGQPYFQEAADKLKELVEGKNVTLECDVDDTDRYGRLLRHVFVNGVFVNAEMVKNGYATVYILKPNVKYEKELNAAWNECLAKKINLCKPPSNSLCDNSCIEISYFHFNAEGNDHYNLNDEYVTFKSTCSYPCDLAGWIINDEANHIYAFPSFVFVKDQTVTVYTGYGTNTKTDLYWGSGRAIWNNNGDTLYLRNSEGELVLDYTYTGS